MVKRTFTERTWDSLLLTLTFVSLLFMGLVSLSGMVFSGWKNLTQPGWENTWLYSHYLTVMNSYALPLALALVILTIICIPKRLINQKHLAYWLMITILCSLPAYFFYDWKGFLVVFFGSSLLISFLSICFFLIRPQKLKFQAEGRIYRFGSLLLHSGYLIFLANIAIFYKSQTPLKLFWIAFVLITAGNVLLVIPETFKPANRKTLNT